MTATSRQTRLFEYVCIFTFFRSHVVTYRVCNASIFFPALLNDKHITLFLSLQDEWKTHGGGMDFFPLCGLMSELKNRKCGWGRQDDFFASIQDLIRTRQIGGQLLIWAEWVVKNFWKLKAEGFRRSYCTICSYALQISLIFFWWSLNRILH